MTSRYSFANINAFTQAGSDAIGNPASICLVDAFPDDDVMGQSAKLLGTPMTSFLTATSAPDTYSIRHFSPDGVENHVCGHASIAAAEFLARQNPDYRAGRDVTFKLNPKYAINADNSFHARIKDRDITLIIPLINELERVDDPGFYTRLARALGIRKQDIDGPAYYAPRIINYVVGIKDEAVLRSIKPDFNKLVALARSKKFTHEGIMLTAKPQTGPFDLTTRVFLPVIGVDEDIACGSSMCSVIPYWAMKRAGAFPDDKQEFTNLFSYPPCSDKGQVGGIQKIFMEAAKGQIHLTGQATYHGDSTIDRHPDRKLVITP